MRRLAALTTTLGLAGLPAGAAPVSAARVMTHWTPEPVAVLGLIWLAWIYLRGLNRAYAREMAVADWRPVVFLAGLFLIFVALTSPLAWLSGRLFWLHQLQLLLLRVLGPLLIFLSAPQRFLFTGMPKPVRRGAFARVWRFVRARPGLRRLAHPLAAGGIFIGVLAVNLIPAVQEPTARWWGLRYLMGLVFLGSGLLFFRTLFDRRDPEDGGPRYGHRVLMLVFTSLTQVVLGAILTFKEIVIYPAFGPSPRLFGMTAMDDEAAGGFMNWAAISLTLLLVVFVVFTAWNASEVRAYNRARNFTGKNSDFFIPETAEELWMIVTPRNKRLGYSLAVIPVVMMAL
ncbi:MAG: cytochrome c oxidase assembly protein, partial [Paracoccaceae bacterium]|nr:cytochrome c oxidase assembly protein [Paracoccaceae bacterium]